MAEHYLGWNPERAQAARADLMAKGLFCRPLAVEVPDAWSLGKFRRRYLTQGQCGSCWVHGATQFAEISMNALGIPSFDVCRMLIGYVGKQIEGGGSLCNGGSVADAFSALMADYGGLAHEDLDPYDPYQAGRRPSESVYADAKKAYVAAHVDIQSDDDARIMIYQGHPVGNGIWWPYGWDNQQTFMTTIGGGVYGHALLEIGYAKAGVFDQYAWFELDNWHDLLYPPLPDKFASKVPGYTSIRSDRTSSFWVRADVYEAVRNKGYAERMTAVSVNGIDKITTRPDSFRKAIPF